MLIAAMICYLGATLCSVFQFFICKLAVDKYEKLRNVVIDYLKSEGHDACWTNRKALADAIGEGVLAFPYLPPKDEFLTKCNEYYDFLEKGKNGQGKCCGPDRT